MFLPTKAKQTQQACGHNLMNVTHQVLDHYLPHWLHELPTMDVCTIICTKFQTNNHKKIYVLSFWKANTSLSLCQLGLKEHVFVGKKHVMEMFMKYWLYLVLQVKFHIAPIVARQISLMSIMLNSKCKTHGSTLIPWPFLQH